MSGWFCFLFFFPFQSGLPQLRLVTVREKHNHIMQGLTIQGLYKLTLLFLKLKTDLKFKLGLIDSGFDSHQNRVVLYTQSLNGNRFKLAMISLGKKGP